MAILQTLHTSSAGPNHLYMTAEVSWMEQRLELGRHLSSSWLDISEFLAEICPAGLTAVRSRLVLS